MNLAPAVSMPRPGRSSRKLRIGALNLTHETVTFLGNDTTLQDFLYDGSPLRGEALLRSDPKGYMGGFVKQAREFPEVELVGIESPLWPKTGIASGWVTREAFEHFVGRMLSELERLGPFDGVYLALHGAMAVRGIARPEVELARRVRLAIGADAVIAATFDPHGNQGASFFDAADFAFAAKYYPHYDCYLQGERAARALVRGLRGDYRVVSATRKIPIISPTVMQWTGAAPWMNLVQRCLTWEAREPDVFVNLFFGFPWADTQDAGMAVQVMTNDQPQLAQAIASDIANAAWRARHALLSSTKIHAIEDCVGLARQAIAAGAGPVVLADHSDRSGSATWLLHAIVAQGLRNTLVVAVVDAQAIAGARAGGVRPGDPFDAPVGGRVDVSAGAPVRIQGRVEHVALAAEGSACGSAWMSVRFGNGNLLVISEYLVQIVEPATLVAMGLDLGGVDVVAIKSRVHFRRGFDDSGFAGTILLVEPPEPFLGTVRLDGLVYEHLDLTRFYPYGQPDFDGSVAQAPRP